MPNSATMVPGETGFVLSNVAELTTPSNPISGGLATTTSNDSEKAERSPGRIRFEPAMRIVYLLLGLSLVLGWLGFELRPRDRALSNVLYGFAGLFLFVVTGALFEWY